MAARELQRLVEQLSDGAQPALGVGEAGTGTEAGRPEHALVEHLGRRVGPGTRLGSVAGKAVGERDQSGGVLK